jgi:thiol-disulfide isomerase/thioredoxin
MPRVLIPIGVIVLAVAAGLLVLKWTLPEHAAHPGAQTVAIGAPLQLPDLYQWDPGAKTTQNIPAAKLPEKFRKNVVFINFWATWCEACMTEIPSILALKKRFESRGLDVVLMNVDENPEKVLAPTLKMLNIDFPVFVDKTRDWSQQLQVRGIPFTVILKDGKVVFFETGDRDWDSKSVREQFEKWLKPA